jgi:CDGSH-type Zn-finger protein
VTPGPGTGPPAPKVAADEADELPAASVTVYPDGPLIVRGDFHVRGVDGATVPTGRSAALCRCGRSAVKPFCDGSHKIAHALGEADARRTPRA